jgi:hypothetical protein
MPPAQTNPPDIYNSPAIDSDGRIYFGNEIGLLYSLMPDGKVTWIEDIWSLHDQGPALTNNGTLVVATHSPLGLIALNTMSHGLADSPWPKFRQNNANTGRAKAFGPSDVHRNRAIPEAHALSQNYPNPFNPHTKIQFTIDKRQLIIVNMFDILGRETATLVREVKEPGTYTVDFDGSGLSSGVYFCRMQAGDFVQSRKLLVMK